ncbi:uncharacterized protein TRIADDRAFT_60563 [Trichoplax adhaerens]|uniref:G-protein coupled receptors family 1 profile domain-containing protein n=1 Tax=Trichoplax adhaerens TaxID=10228 RepID=B3S8J5_TRIAD|nr:hypothetical protein TRIADDRAFT_60563 [Trichoplax adhaerens]EDV20895.1 hypothetical protein TRIADDRAFT_60563 [Trichoplax adhaerens]|eukprot:XP_002116539.1 hypothetical protein TRIADDRAFT_60563 [Trichoplax adhaerens]
MTEVLAGSVSNFVVNPIKTTLLQCVLSIPLRTTMFCIFTLHVTMLSLERFYSVIYPFKYRRFVNKKNATIVLFLTWAVPLFFVVLLIEFISYLQFGYCFPWSNMGIFALVLVYILPPLTFFLPPLVTFFVYLKILRQIDALERKIWSVSCQKEETCRWTSYRHMLRHRKVLFQMFTILAVYSLAFIPCIVVYLVYFTHYDTSLLLPILITYLMATSYLFIHPVLAIIFTAAIKSEFKKKFGRHYWLSAGRSFCRCHRYWANCYVLVLIISLFDHIACQDEKMANGANSHLRLVTLQHNNPKVYDLIQTQKLSITNRTWLFIYCWGDIAL